MDFRHCCCSKIILFGILYATTSYSLQAQSTPTKTKQRKKPEESIKLLQQSDSLSKKKDTKILSNSQMIKDTILEMETVYRDGNFSHLPRSLKQIPPLSTDSLTPLLAKPIVVDIKKEVLLEYRKSMDKNCKLGEPQYRINPNAFRVTPGNGSENEMKTVYEGGQFRQVPRNEGTKASVGMPAFIVGGKKEVSKKNKRILKDAFGIEIK